MASWPIGVASALLAEGRPFLHAGSNELKIVVANTAINELAGRASTDYRLLWLCYGKRFASRIWIIWNLCPREFWDRCSSSPQTRSPHRKEFDPMTSRKRMGTAMQRLLLAAALLAATPLLAQTPAAAQAISPQDQKGIDGDINRHSATLPPIPAPGRSFPDHCAGRRARRDTQSC